MKKIIALLGTLLITGTVPGNIINNVKFNIHKNNTEKIKNKTYYSKWSKNEKNFNAKILGTNFLKLSNDILSVKPISNNNVYIATFEGVYYLQDNGETLNHIEGINEPISQIEVAYSDSVYFLSISGNAYYLNSGTLNAQSITDWYPNEIKNVTSIKSNYNSIYYSTDHGVYYMKKNSWTPHKIEGINEPIEDIIFYNYPQSNNNFIFFKSFFSNKISSIHPRQYNPPTIIIDKNDEEINEQRLLSAGIGDAVNGMNQGFLNFINSFYGTNQTRGIQDYLMDERIIIPRTQELWTRNIPYQLNNQSGYFVVNVDIRQSAINNRRLQLVFRRNDFYLQGFVVRNGNSYTSSGTYYYFSDADYQNLERETNIINSSLNITSSYTAADGLNSSELNPSINWNSIISSFNNLISYNGLVVNNNFRNSLTTVIFATAESWRFHHLFPRIAETSISYNSFNWNEYAETLRSWGRSSGSRNLTPLDISRFNFPLTNSREQYFDFNHWNWILFASIRIVLPKK